MIEVTLLVFVLLCSTEAEALDARIIGDAVAVKRAEARRYRLEMLLIYGSNAAITVLLLSPTLAGNDSPIRFACLVVLDLKIIFVPNGLHKNPR